MDADPDHGGHKRVMLFCMDHHPVQPVIVQDAVVDPFRCGTLVINLLISVCAAGDFCIKPDIPFRSGFNDSPIFGIRTAVPVFGAVVFPIGASPHEIAAGTVITIGLHAEFFLA